MNKDTRYKKNKSRKKPFLLLIPVVLAAIILIGIGAFYMSCRSQKGFLEGTTLNGQDVSGKTAAEISDEQVAKYKDVTVTLLENSSEALTGKLSDYGYTFDQDSFEQALTKKMQEEKSSLSLMFKARTSGYALSIEDACSFDPDVFSRFVTSASFAEPRVESKDAELTLDEANNTYVVSEPVQGNMIDDAKLQSYVKEQIDAYLAGDADGSGKSSSGSLKFSDSTSNTASSSNSSSSKDSDSSSQASDGGVKVSGSGLEISLPSSLYTSKTVSTDTADLEAEAKEKTKDLRLKAYDSMSITYTFGDETYEVDNETLKSWISVDDDLNVTVDEEKLKSFINDLAMKYNTRHLQRTFKTTGGGTVIFSDTLNDYGYIIDQDAELQQLESDVKGMQSVTREPVYVKTNDWGNPYYYKRNGTDDLAGNYVEVDLTSQHLWFYKDGALVVESDIVSGNASKGLQTQTGVFPLAYKESPATLTGTYAETESWKNEVQYWMPFFEGEGLHDADWRTSFGGQIYQTNGSHGCINLPPAVAKTIFETISAGTPIVIYNEGQDASTTNADYLKKLAEQQELQADTSDTAQPDAQ
ncbi:MAG: L,D-transpeptidase family protein [Eubacterium sp.]|nr:L,D-transpeptidase family protein [Eubacterium sp.]